MTRYKILHSPERAKRGLPAWGVFEIISPEFSRGVSAHHTEAEAKAALAELEKENGK